ncbi:hypothetical protein GQ44DRAFT_779069 [Phaeosphaeriaceae sp. PMI808]|nr:hypothetical protein GQ44DRAFT_779069 [Phaeosphaeriaceae sp. PMI808]
MEYCIVILGVNCCPYRQGATAIDDERDPLAHSGHGYMHEEHPERHHSRQEHRRAEHHRTEHCQLQLGKSSNGIMGHPHPIYSHAIQGPSCNSQAQGPWDISTIPRTPSRLDKTAVETSIHENDATRPVKVVAAHQLKSGDIHILTSTTAETTLLKNNKGWLRGLG